MGRTIQNRSLRKSKVSELHLKSLATWTLLSRCSHLLVHLQCYTMVSRWFTKWYSRPVNSRKSMTMKLNVDFKIKNQSLSSQCNIGCLKALHMSEGLDIRHYVNLQPNEE